MIRFVKTLRGYHAYDGDEFVGCIAKCINHKSKYKWRFLGSFRLNTAEKVTWFVSATEAAAKQDMFELYSMTLERKFYASRFWLDIWRMEGCVKDGNLKLRIMDEKV